MRVSEAVLRAPLAASTAPHPSARHAQLATSRQSTTLLAQLVHDAVGWILAEHLQERPAKLYIICIDKPASSAPKCSTCKERLVRGDFALQEREYNNHSGLNLKVTHNLIELISQTNSKVWQWRVRWSKTRCLKKSCVGCSPMPVVVIVPSGKEEAARTAIYSCGLAMRDVSVPHRPQRRWQHHRSARRTRIDHPFVASLWRCGVKFFMSHLLLGRN